MPYNKTDWVPGQAVITTDELNNLETQYDSVVDDITVSGSPVEAALSATYVSQIDATGKSLADLNAWLAVPSALGIKRLAGAAAINGPLIVPSGTYLDSSGATITLDAASASNILRNSAVTAGRTVADAATSGATLTSATANFAQSDVGSTVAIAGATAGAHLLVTTITAVTNATTATLALAAGTAVTGASAVITPRDRKITLVGGTWNCGAGLGTNYNSFAFRLRHVDHLVVRDVTVNSTSGKYAISVGDATDLQVAGLRGVTNSDGVHLAGPLSGATIRDIAGTFGDDIVAITPYDWDAYADTLGPVSDVVIDGIDGTTTAACLTLLGGADAPLTGVRARNIGGVSTNASRGAILIGNDPGFVGTASGFLDDIVVENITATAPTTSHIFTLAPVNAGAIRLSGLSLASQVNSAIYVQTGKVIDSLLIDKPKASLSVASNLISVDGTVNDLKITASNWCVPSSYLVALGNAAAIVSNLIIAHGRIKPPTNGGGIVQATNTGHTLPVVQLNAVTADNVSALVDVATTTVLTMSATRLLNPSGNGVANVRAGGALTVQGSGNQIAHGPSHGIAVAAGATAAVMIDDIQPTDAAGSFPTIVAGAASGTGASAPAIGSGSNRAGWASVRIGTSPAAGASLCVITFSGTLPRVPTVTLTPMNSQAAAAGLYVSARSTTSFTVGCANAPSGDPVQFAYRIDG